MIDPEDDESAEAPDADDQPRGPRPADIYRPKTESLPDE